MRKYLILSLLFLFYALPSKSLDVEVDILNNNYEPLPILFSQFYTTKEIKPLSKQLLQIIIENFDESGVFDSRLSNENILPYDVNLPTYTIDTQKYIFYNYLVVGKFLYNTPEKRYTIEILVLDTHTNEVKTQKGYEFSKNTLQENLKLIANDISNEIYESITGLSGYFNSNLTYVENENTLMIADYNGKNKRQLVKVAGKIYGPVFSHNNQHIVYVNFLDGRSQIYIYDIAFEKTIRLGDFKGLSLSPRFSPDNRRILFSIAHEGVANIFEIDIISKSFRKLTNSASINLAGNYSLDSENIIFNSDRIGSPQVYLMNKDGKNIQKMSFGEGSYYNPTFSPNANLILATKIFKGQFYIVILSLEKKEKIIASDYFVESPSWLQDGRHVIYQYSYSPINQKPLYAFYILDIISGYKLNVSPANSALDPSMSKNIELNKKIIKKYELIKINHDTEDTNKII